MTTTPLDDGAVVLRACHDCQIVDEFPDRIASRSMPCSQTHRTSIIVVREIGTKITVDEAFKIALDHARRAYATT